MPESPEAAYDRGESNGRVAQRLAGIDAHFVTINGSIERTATELHDMRLAVQRLGDQHAADALTRIATAEALKDASEKARSPLVRTSLVVGIVVAAVGTPISIYLAAR